jgi:hypothetical protein
MAGRSLMTIVTRGASRGATHRRLGERVFQIEFLR